MRSLLLLPLLLLAACSDDKPMRHVVTSGSMEPTLHVGQEFMVVPYSAGPNEGDIVLLNLPGYNKPVVHRLMLIDGNMAQTKGDANKLYDNAVPITAIVGQAFPITP